MTAKEKPVRLADCPQCARAGMTWAEAERLRRARERQERKLAKFVCCDPRCGHVR